MQTITLMLSSGFAVAVFTKIFDYFTGNRKKEFKDLKMTVSRLELILLYKFAPNERVAIDHLNDIYTSNGGNSYIKSMHEEWQKNDSQDKE